MARKWIQSLDLEVDESNIPAVESALKNLMGFSSESVPVLYGSYRLAVDTTSQSIASKLAEIGAYGIEIPTDLAAVKIIPEDETPIRTNLDAPASDTSPKLADAGETIATDAATCGSTHLYADAPTFVTVRLYVPRDSAYRPIIVPWQENHLTYLDMNWYPALTADGQWALALTFRATQHPYAGQYLLSCQANADSGLSVRRGENAGEYVIRWPSSDGSSDLNLTIDGLPDNQWHTLVVVCKGSATGDGQAWAFAAGSDRATVTQSGVGKFTPYDLTKVRIAASTFQPTMQPTRLWSLACAGLWNLDYGPFSSDSSRGVETLDDNAVAALRTTLGCGPVMYRRTLREAIESYGTVMDSAILGALVYPTAGSRYDWHYLDQHKNAVTVPITGTFAKGGWYTPHDETYNGKPVYRNTWAEPVKLWWDGGKWIISDSSAAGDTDCDHWVQDEPAEDFSDSLFVPASGEAGFGQAVQPQLEEFSSFIL